MRVEDGGDHFTWSTSELHDQVTAQVVKARVLKRKADDRRDISTTAVYPVRAGTLGVRESWCGAGLGKDCPATRPT
jgi:hypothetical protein